MHQRARLIEVGHVEGDTKLQRRQRQAALEHRAAGVEGIHRLTARTVVAGDLQLLHQFMNDVVHHRLLIRCDVVAVRAVEVDTAHIQRITAQLARNRLHDVLNGNRTLRATKAAECGVALSIGLTRIAVHEHIGQPVGIVEMAQRSRHHRARQIGRMTGTRDHGNLHTKNAALVVMAKFIFVPEAVAATGNHEVVVAIQTQLDGAFQSRRSHRSHAGKQAGL